MDINNKMFGGLIQLTAQALDVRSERQNLIQSNIANLETPGYKVQELPFAKVMEGIMAQKGNLARTHPVHIGVDTAERGRLMEYRKENRPPDLDAEMLKLSENQLMYEIGAKIMAKKFEGLKYAIDEGGR